MKWLRWFIAGALAVPLGHELVIWLLHTNGAIDRKPFAMTPMPPFGVPALISLSLWSGIWGLLLGLVLLRAKAQAFWFIAIAFGAIAPTLVTAFVVARVNAAAMQRMPQLIVTGLMVNGAWGWMTAVFYRLMSRESAAI